MGLCCTDDHICTGSPTRVATVSVLLHHVQGIHALVDFAPIDDTASNLLCQLYNHRASARLGLHKAAAALEDALASIRTKKKFAKGYLRAATCHIKLGQLKAAAAVLDQVNCC